MHKGIIILGLCQLTKGAIDIFIKNNLIIYGILEDEKKFHHTEIFGVPVLGATDDKAFQPLFDANGSYYIAYHSIKKRKQYLKQVASQAVENLISAIHPSASMGTHIQLGFGNYIGAQVCLAPEVTLHNHCIVHNGVKIETGTTIHDFVQIGGGSVIGNNVTLEEEVFIGPGVTIIDGVTIQKGASIGAGSVILGHVKSGDFFLENPAKSIKTT